MSSQFRRAIKGWKREALTFWGKFNTFKRMVIGIIISMSIIYGSREALLDPMGDDVAKLTEKMTKDGVPDVVPLPEDDSEVQEDMLKIEGRQNSTKEERKQLSALIEKTRFAKGASIADASAEILRLATPLGLNLHENIGCDERDASPVPVSASLLELRGDFLAIRSFLKQVEQAPLRWRLDRITLVMLQDEQGFPFTTKEGKPLLSLRFRLQLFNFAETKY